MKTRKLNKILFIIILLLSINSSIAQLITDTADVDIILDFSDNAGHFFNHNIHFGLDHLATDGFDRFLGEDMLPPWSPALEVRFQIGAEQSYMDFRNAPSFPYSGTVIYNLEWHMEQGSSATEFTIGYNLPTNVAIRIQDKITGTLFDSGQRTGSGSFTITIPLTTAKLTATYNTILPVELVSFDAVTNENSVSLIWETATEINNYGFEIERKVGSEQATDSNWELIAFVNGNGNSSSPKFYSFEDKNTKTGNYSYRLKQIDFNGDFKYSNVIEVLIGSPTEFSLEQNFPNPFNPSTTVKFSIPQDGLVTIKVFNMLGEEITTLFSGNTQKGNYTLNWNGKDNSGNFVSSGSYIYRMTAGDFTQSKKMMFLK